MGDMEQRQSEFLNYKRHKGGSAQKQRSLFKAEELATIHRPLQTGDTCKLKNMDTQRAIPNYSSIIVLKSI